MKPVTNRTQNKVRREDANGQLAAQLRKQNNQLKTLAARLKKEINRLNCLTPDDPEFEEPQAPVPSSPVCLACGQSSLLEMTLPNGKVMTICKLCKAVNKHVDSQAVPA